MKAGPTRQIAVDPGWTAGGDPARQLARITSLSPPVFERHHALAEDSGSDLKLCTATYLPVGSQVKVELKGVVVFGEVRSCEELGFAAYWVKIAVSERIMARAGLGGAK